MNIYIYGRKQTYDITGPVLTTEFRACLHVERFNRFRVVYHMHWSVKVKHTSGKREEVKGV